VVRREDQIRELSDQFINVRLIKCNSLDLQLFQFDYDLTFCVFFLNADKTIYARYGTRNGHDADNDVAIEGLVATMRAALAIHRDYPSNAGLLKANQPIIADQKIPEDFRSLRHFKSELDYDGQVAKSCIHCHQVRDAARKEYRQAGKRLPQKLLFPFPSSQVLGFELDKKTTSTVDQIDRRSPAADAGLLPNDRIQSINGQLISSEADLRWALHNISNDLRSLNLELLRGEEPTSVKIQLPPGWRNRMDLSWRTTTWDLRRMATGGMSLVAIDEARRKELGITSGKMALLAKHVGMYGDHARAKKAGLRKNDIVVSFDGRDDLLTETALIEHAMQKKFSGDKVDLVYVRNGKRRTASFDLQ